MTDATQNFDLASRFGSLTEKQNEGIDLPIVDPKTGNRLGIVFRVVGPDSDVVKAATAAVVQERTDQHIRKINIERMEEEAIRLAAASVISWNDAVIDGMSYSAANTIKVMQRYAFIREQVAGFSHDRGNFLTN